MARIKFSHLLFLRSSSLLSSPHLSPARSISLLTPGLTVIRCVLVASILEEVLWPHTSLQSWPWFSVPIYSQTFQNQLSVFSLHPILSSANLAPTPTAPPTRSCCPSGGPFLTSSCGALGTYAPSEWPPPVISPVLPCVSYPTCTRYASLRVRPGISIQSCGGLIHPYGSKEQLTIDHSRLTSPTIELSSEFFTHASVSYPTCPLWCLTGAINDKKELWIPSHHKPPISMCRTTTTFYPVSCPSQTLRNYTS